MENDKWKMILNHLALQNFRNYPKADFTFNNQLTVIVGSNAAGKTNLIEAIFMLVTGKSFRTDKDKQLIMFGETICRVKGMIRQRKQGIVSLASLRSGSQAPRNDVDLEDEEENLEVIFSANSNNFLQKKYLVNAIPKRRVDFAGKLTAVLFTPVDLDIALGQPSGRRRFLDEVLEQTDYDYRLALSLYSKAIRQRNALLEQVQKTGIRDEERFSYWNELVIKNGQVVSRKRESLIEYINKREKSLFPFSLLYDKSEISEERLLQYKDAEVGAGVTLVGPHRDDVVILAHQDGSDELEDVKYFSSRGQQRLVVLELKLSHIYYIMEQTGEKPLLLLDDIFSELDSSHIADVIQHIEGQQVILTTTHKEFVNAQELRKGDIIEVGKKS